MLLSNPLIIEDQNDKEVFVFDSEGNPGQYPIPFYSPFTRDDAFISNDDMVGFKTTIKEAIKNMETVVLSLDGKEIDKSFKLNIKETVQSILSDIKGANYPDDYEVALYYGLFGDLMTIDNVKNLIPDKLREVKNKDAKQVK